MGSLSNRQQEFGYDTQTSCMLLLKIFFPAANENNYWLHITDGNKFETCFLPGIVTHFN